MDREAHFNKLDKIEKILKVIVIPDKFCIENGMLTNTHKLKRQ